MTARIILAAALAVAVLAGCGSGGSSAPAASAPAASATAATLACKHSYQQWKTGPAEAAVRQLLSALKALQAAGSARSVSAAKAAVKKAGQAAARLASFPVPACADPHGYFPAILARVRAAAGSADTANGLTAMVQALAPLTAVPALEAKFTAEVNRATGA